MFGFVRLSSTLGQLAPRTGAPLAAACRIVAGPQNHSNLFGMISLAAPRHLTPMKSYRYPKTTGGLLPFHRLREAPTIFRTFFQVPYALSLLFSHSSKNNRGGILLHPERRALLVHPASERLYPLLEFRVSRFAFCNHESPVSTSSIIVSSTP